MSSFEKHSPGKMPRCRNQYIAAKEEQKKTPSTIANAIKRDAKGRPLLPNHLKHHRAFARTVGTVSIARNIRSCSSPDVTNNLMK